MPAEPRIFHIPADGTISREARERLKEKRIELGLAMKSVGAVLGLNWATIRKWETGDTIQCSITNRRKLERFLNGEFDGAFEQGAASKTMRDAVPSGYKALLSPAGVPSYLKRLMAVHDLTGSKPGLRDEYMRGIEALTDEILAKLAAWKE